MGYFLSLCRDISLLSSLKEHRFTCRDHVVFTVNNPVNYVPLKMKVDDYKYMMLCFDPISNRYHYCHAVMTISYADLYALSLTNAHLCFASSVIDRNDAESVQGQTRSMNLQEEYENTSNDSSNADKVSGSSTLEWGWRRAGW